MCYALHLDMFEATLTCSQGPNIVTSLIGISCKLFQFWPLIPPIWDQHWRRTHIYYIYIIYVQFNILLHLLLLYSAKLQHSEGFDNFIVLYLVHALF